jgi:energy-coupling factor transport system permease protein
MNKTDPRTKLIICILVIGAVFTAQNPTTVLSQSALVLTAVLFLRQARSFAQGLKMTIPMVGLVFSISFISLDLNQAFWVAARLFNIFTTARLVFGYLTPEELSCALRHMKVPFGMVFMISTGMRFVPLMRKKIASVREAQMSRGVDLRFRLKNVGNFMAMLVPVLTQSLILSEELAVAMEVRGFGRKNRSSRKTLRFRKTDYFLCAFSILAFAAFVAWESIIQGWIM